MAKSVHTQKKRVTHIGKLTNDNLKSDNGSLLSDCFDYVHNIMQEMDCSIKSVGCDKSDQLFHEVKSLDVQKNSEAQITNTSSSNDLQKLKASNLKKYSIPRKYPLMEKSQKILRQLKHNRSIPKQRAHLASFQDSSVSKASECQTAAVSKRKTKNCPIVKEKILIKKNLSKKTCSKKTCSQNSFVDYKHSKCISKTAETNNICQPQKIIENSNPYLSDSTTDSEYERFVQKNKMALHKEVLKDQKKSKKTLKTNEKIKPKKKLSGLEENSRSLSLQSDPDFIDYSSSGSDDSNTHKRKISHLSRDAKANRRKNKQRKRSVNPEYDESKTTKKKKIRNPKVAEEKSQKVEENVDTGNSLQSWSEQYDSNFRDDSSESDNENNHKKKVSLVSMKINTKGEDETCINSEVSNAKEISGINIETSSGNLHCAQESSRFSPRPSSIAEKENLNLFTSTEVVADNLSVVSFPSNLVFCSKSNELNSKDPVVVKINDTLYNLSQNQIEAKSGEHHLRVSELSSSSTKFSKSSLENSIVITLSSESDSDTETEIMSVSKKNNSSCEMVIETQNTPLSLSNEEPDLEIIEVISSKKSIPSNSKMINYSENLTIENSSSLYTQDRINYSKSHLIKEITKCSQTADKTNYLSKIFSDNVFESTLSKDEMKKIIALCNVTQIKKEKVDKDPHLATYTTNICRDFNETEIVPKINEVLKSPTKDGTHIFESVSFKSIDCVSPIIKDVSSCASICSVKHEKGDNDIIIIDSGESKGETFHNVVKDETYDNDVIFIDDFVKTKCKDICKINSDCNTLQNENICSSIKTEKFGNALQNYVVHCSNIPKLLSSNNSTSLLKSDIKTECSVSDNNVQAISVQENAAMMEKELLCQINTSDVKEPVEKAVCLLEIFKKEFKTYQEILRTEKNVQAGLKFVEAHQAQKLDYLKSTIQNLLKDNSDNSVNSNCMTIKEQQGNLMQDCAILNNPENPTLKELQHSFVGCSEVFSNDCSAVVDSHMNRNLQDVSHSCTSVYDSSVVKKEPGSKPMTCCLDEQIAMQVQDPHLSCKSENNFIEESSYIGEKTIQSSFCVKSEEKTLNLLDKKCNVCGKDAVAACQKCAKVFFCSHKCGKKFWTDGHEKICGQ